MISVIEEVISGLKLIKDLIVEGKDAKDSVPALEKTIKTLELNIAHAKKLSHKLTAVAKSTTQVSGTTSRLVSEAVGSVQTLGTASHVLGTASHVLGPIAGTLGSVLSVVNLVQAINAKKSLTEILELVEIERWTTGIRWIKTLDFLAEGDLDSILRSKKDGKFMLFNLIFNMDRGSVIAAVTKLKRKDKLLFRLRPDSSKIDRDFIERASPLHLAAMIGQLDEEDAEIIQFLNAILVHRLQEFITSNPTRAKRDAYRLAILQTTEITALSRLERLVKSGKQATLTVKIASSLAAVIALSGVMSSIIFTAGLAAPVVIPAAIAGMLGVASGVTTIAGFKSERKMKQGVKALTDLGAEVLTATSGALIMLTHPGVQQHLKSEFSEVYTHDSQKITEIIEELMIERLSLDEEIVDLQGSPSLASITKKAEYLAIHTDRFIETALAIFEQSENDHTGNPNFKSYEQILDNLTELQTELQSFMNDYRMMDFDSSSRPITIANEITNTESGGVDIEDIDIDRIADVPAVDLELALDTGLTVERGSSLGLS